MSWSHRVKQVLFGDEARGAESTEEHPARNAVEAVLESGDVSGESVLANLEAVVVELSEGHLCAQDVDPSAPLFDFGYVDSLSAVSLLAFIEERYGVSIADVELVGRLSSLGALAEFVERAVETKR